MIYLKKLSLTDDIVGIYNMLQEIALNENGFNNKVYGMSFDQFKQWLKKNMLLITATWKTGWFRKLHTGYMMMKNL